MRWLSGSNQVCSLSKRTCFIHLNGGSGLTEFSIVMERSWTGDAFPCRKSSSVWSRLSSRWCADIHWKCQPDKQTLVLTLGFQTGKKSGVICGMKSKKRWYVKRKEEWTQNRSLRDPRTEATRFSHRFSLSCSVSVALEGVYVNKESAATPVSWRVERRIWWLSRMTAEEEAALAVRGAVSPECPALTKACRWSRRLFWWRWVKTACSSFF